MSQYHGWWHHPSWSCICHHHFHGCCDNNVNDEIDKEIDEAIVLGVYIHCQGCQDEVISALRGFDGVEMIEVDANNDKVKVIGNKADPIKVEKRLRKKTGKNVKLLSPIPKKEDKTEEKEKEVKMVREYALRIHMHCDGCEKEAKYGILDMKGVETVEIDMKKNLVKVKGMIDPQRIVELVRKRLGRHAEILNQTINDEESRGGNNSDRCGCHYHPRLDVVYAPQLFSDENPNSCSVM